MKHAFVRELLRRRVLSILGLYLAAAWGLLEFSDWATGRFDWPARFEDGVVLTCVLLLPVVMGLAWKWGAPGSLFLSRMPREPAPRSVAVLPFVNMSGDPAQEYLGDGLSEEVINALATVPDLLVASRTSAFTYKGTSRDVRSIGRELGVGAILEGSFQRSGDRIRVTTQLVGVADGYHLWSERFDEEMSDVFAIEDEIAEQVARALRAILKGQSWQGRPRLHPSDIRAYEYVLRGEQFLLNPRAKNLGFAQEMFRRAIEADPDYASGWVGAAEAAALIKMFYPARERELEEADKASREALRLAPDLAEAHAARALTLFLMRCPDDAEEEFQKALALNPRLFQARYFHGRACFQAGRLEEAASEFQEAASIKEDYQAAFFAAQASEALGDEEEAQVRLAEALRVVEKHMELNPDDPRAATIRAVALRRLGRTEDGLRWAERALEIDPEDAGVRYNVACLYSLAGKVDEAIGLLEEAFARGFRNKEWFEKDPDLAPIRDDPRFQELLAQI